MKHLDNRFAIIIAGGKGERFWPQSRLKTPKHLLPIVGEKTMIEQTIARLQGSVALSNILVITNQEQKDAILTTCPFLTENQVIAEPSPKDTAAAVGVACLCIEQKNPRACVGVVAADQSIHDLSTYTKTLNNAFELAQNAPIIVTIGIKPTFPATGYGYIKKGYFYKEIDGIRSYGVSQFVEKPSLPKAQNYLDCGDYFWNTGSFISEVKVLRQAFLSHSQDIHLTLSKIEEKLKNKTSLELALKEFYPEFKKISIDYAIMEKASNIIMIEAFFDWDDVGAWPALERHIKPDANRNTKQGLIATLDAHGNILISQKDHLLSVIGIDNAIVVHTADATLVCSKNKSDSIKELLKDLAQRPECQTFL